MPQTGLSQPGADVWLAAIDDDSAPLWLARIGLLNASERARFDAYKAEGARMQFLAARVLLRATLSRYAAVASKEWDFSLNDYGRPAICWPRSVGGLEFNLSHTDGLVACAISPLPLVGVDVERLSCPRDLHSLMRFSFSPREIGQVKLGAPDGGCDGFFTLWTLKEAYIKARGLGLSVPLQDFWFDIGGAAPIIHLAPHAQDRAERWHFWSNRPTTRHRLSLGLAAGSERPSVRIGWVCPAQDGGWVEQGLGPL